MLWASKGQTIQEAQGPQKADGAELVVKPPGFHFYGKIPAGPALNADKLGKHGSSHRESVDSGSPATAPEKEINPGTLVSFLSG